jgi:orotate phosphoribosyltransferase-like protein
MEQVPGLEEKGDYEAERTSLLHSNYCCCWGKEIVIVTDVVIEGYLVIIYSSHVVHPSLSS